MKKYMYLIPLLPIIGGLLFWLIGHPFKQGFYSVLYMYWVVSLVIVGMLHFISNKNFKIFLLFVTGSMCLNAQESVLSLKGGFTSSFYNGIIPVDSVQVYFYEGSFMRKFDQFQAGITASNTSVGLDVLYDFESDNMFSIRTGLLVHYRYNGNFQTIDDVMYKKHLFISPYVEGRLCMLDFLCLFARIRTESLDGVTGQIGANLSINFKNKEE